MTRSQVQIVPAMTDAVKKTLVNRRGGIPASILYELIPPGVRMAGESAVLEYLARHDLSHIASAKNAPEATGQPGNVLFEGRTVNRARGASDMVWHEELAARGTNLSANAVGWKAAASRVGKGTLVGALAEIPVSVSVQILHVANGRKTSREAIRHGAASVATGAAYAAGGRAILMGAAAAATAVGMPLTPPVVAAVASIGNAAYLWSSAKRVVGALAPEARSAMHDTVADIEHAIERAEDRVDAELTDAYATYTELLERLA